VTKVLKINSSLYSQDGQSSQLATQFVDALRERDPALQLVERDLARDPVPHLDAARFQAFLTKAEDRSDEQRAVTDYSDALIRELREADVIVLGLPMYNFGIPSQLKAWFDHVARAGVTFRYTDKGAVGLLTGKKAYVVATRGGVYAGTPNDFQAPFVLQFLGFVGITDVEVVYAEGLALGEESANKSIAAAQARVRRLTELRIAA
jgi:FMN-dependent NADH-azoreductase